MFNPNIPIATNKLSVSQPQIQTNFSTSNTIFGIDHFPYTNGTSNQGKHIWVEMPNLNQSVYTLPSAPLQGTLYTKQVTVGYQSTTQSQLFCWIDGVAQEWRLTGVDSVNSATFGTDTNYNVPSVVSPYPPSSMPVPNQFGGWTFLPGGLILQYGVMKTTGNSTQVNFPVVFTTLCSITATVQQTPSGGLTYGISTRTTAGFLFTASSSSVGTQFNWMAIGIE